MRNKHGFLLAEETLKIVIALICIGFLVYLLGSLYFVKESKTSYLENFHEKILVGQEIDLQVSGEQHTLTVIDLGPDSIIFTIESDTQTYSLSLGEVKKIDLDEDGYYDLEIKLVYVDGKKDEIFIDKKYIHEKVPEETSIVVKSPKNKYENTELLILLNNANNKLSIDQLIGKVLEKVNTGEYSAIIIGESHYIKEQRDVAMILMKEISKIKRVRLLEEGNRYEEGGESFTKDPIIVKKDEIKHLEYPSDYKDFIEEYNIPHKKFLDQYYPCTEVKKELQNLNKDEILITYTGSAHTTNIFDSFSENFELNPEEMVKMEDCVKENDKKALVVMMGDFDYLIGRNHEIFLREFADKNEGDIESLFEYKSSWGEKIDQVRAELFFVQYPGNEDIFIGTSPSEKINEYIPEIIDSFSVLWGDKTVKEELAEGDYKLSYATTRDFLYGKKVHSVYFLDLTNKKGIKFYLKKNNFGNYKVVETLRVNFD